MIKAVFLDLDNTLLDNPDRRFSAEFRALFDQHFREVFGVENASAALRPAIRRMSEDRADNKTNQSLLLESLGESLSLSKAEVTLAVDMFYQDRYGELRALGEEVAGARRLVDCLLDQGLLVAIATNPLYPESAITQRIAWAGIADLIPDLAFITHSENMHFAKPAPAYYAELIARVGIEPDETLMIGDSVENDIEPARALGIHTWRVDGAGGLLKALEQIHEPNWREDYRYSQLSPKMLLPQFRGNIAALYGLLSEVKPHQWLQRPDPDEWSILQILCHLWSAETEVHQRRLRAIMDDDNPFIAVGTPPGPHIPPCHDDGAEIMERFRSVREDTIALLAQVPPLDWARPARHSIFGLTTLLEMAHFTAQHDRLHITQLCQTLGKCAD